MSNVLAFIFARPVALQNWQHFVLLWPLCLSVSVVYKTTKLEDLRQLPLASLALWATIVLGMYAVGVALWLAYWLLV